MTMPNKITTQQLFDQYVAMNEKLDALDQKLNGIIDGTTPANTQLTGSIVELNKEVYGVSDSVLITPGSYYNLLSAGHYPYKEIRGHLRWEVPPSDYRLMLYYRPNQNFGLFENVELHGEREEFKFDMLGSEFELRLYNEDTEDAYLRLFEVSGVI